MQKLSQQVGKLPTQPAKPPADYQASIEGLTQAVEELRQQVKAGQGGATEQRVIQAQLDRIEQQGYQRPDYKMSRYVQYGLYSYGLMAILLGLMSYYGWSWRGERDEYQQAYEHDNWRVRYTEQANADYFAYMEAKFKDEPDVYKWIIAQEQADQKRELARKAAEQAKALSDQANRLEGTNPYGRG